MRCGRPLFNNVHHGFEAEGFKHGQVAQYLSIQNDPAGVFHVDKLRVRHSMLSDAGADALNPKLSELALPRLSVAVCVLPGLFEARDGHAVTTIRAAAESLGLFQDRLVLFAGKPPRAREHKRMLSVATGSRRPRDRHRKYRVRPGANRQIHQTCPQR